MENKIISSPTTERLMKYWKYLWKESLTAQQKNKLKMMLESGNIIFFFYYKNEVFGATEPNRVMFAKMKDPSDEDHTPEWIKEANFMATNLTKLGQGQATQMIFGEKDLKDIDVLTKEEALKLLEDFFEKQKSDQ